MAKQPYRDPILEAYAELITANNSQIKKVYHGDPIHIPPQSTMPVLIMERDQTRISDTTNVEDEHRIRIFIRVITSVLQDLSDEKSIRAGTAQLYEIMEGRDPDTYKLRDDSIAGILRSNLVVNEQNELRTDIGSISTIRFGTTEGRRNPGAWSVEGEIEIEANFIQVR